MQKILLFLLAFFARNIIKIHRPYIVGITGTVGKTTISGHVYAYLSYAYGKKNVGYSPYHYNGEYGLPLTIIGAKTGGKNPFAWLVIFIKATLRLILPYPRYLVLEYGIDHPGEMDFLLSIAVPNVAILTEVLPNHIEQFGTFEAYRREKLKITESPEELIIHDSQRQFVSREAWYYGRGGMSDIDASHIEIGPTGTRATISADHHEYSLELPVFGEFQIENILPLYALGAMLNLDVNYIATYAKNFVPESGRSGILAGKNNSIIIDGSYNGGYLSLHSGIAALRSFLHSHNLIFLIGDMRELGDETESLHRELANEIVKLFPHQSEIQFHLVGPSMREYVLPILEKHFACHAWLSSRDAGKKIAEILKKKSEKQTMIYVKGSQNTIFLEEGIKEFLASEKDKGKLCRQSTEWMQKKERFFSKLHS